MYWSVTFVLTFVAALKGLYRVDIPRECNSLKHFALYVINKQFAGAIQDLSHLYFQSFPKIA